MTKITFYLLMVAFLVSCGQTSTNKIEIADNLTEEQMLTNWTEMHKSKAENLQVFSDSKYGMFIHWGLYAIPGGIWKGEKMEEMKNRTPRISEWIQYAAKIPRDEYAQLAKEFNPIEFKSDSIAKLAKDAGMKYLVITSKHHDGFAMYDSKVSDFDIMSTPYKQDIIGALYKSCKKYGIDFGIYYSQNLDWADGCDADFKELKRIREEKGLKVDDFSYNLWDPSPNTYEEYLHNKAYPQVRELLTMYPDMKQLWYDMSMYMRPQHSYAFYKLTYDLTPGMVVNQRIGNSFGDFDIPGDNEIPKAMDETKKPWQTVGTLNNSWGYKSYDTDWKSPKELLFWLVEIVSKGGNYMLNIGPDALGNVPAESAENLRTVGAWLKDNGEAIYDTKKWRLNHEGPTDFHVKGTSERRNQGFNVDFTPEDFWFTTKENYVFAIAFTWPEANTITLSSFTEEDKIQSVELLNTGKCEFTFEDNKLTVTLPGGINRDNGYVLKIGVEK